MDIDTVVLVAGSSVASGAVTLGLVGVAWRNRDLPSAPEFGWLMVAVTGWCLFSAGFVLADTPAQAYLFDRLLRLAAVHVAPLFLVFVLAYAGHDRWLSRRWLALISLFPAVYAVALLTSPYHGLATDQSAVTIQTVGGVTAPLVPMGTVELTQNLLSYVLLLFAFGVLFRFLVRSRSIHHRQALGIAAGAVIPVVANATFHLGVRLHPGIDLTPVTFMLTGVVMGWALFRYDFLTSTPVATDILVDELPDPVLVLNDERRVVDHNFAAASAFEDDGLVGADVDDVAPDLLAHVETDEVYSLRNGDGVDFYDVQVTRIEDQHEVEHGRLVVMRDVTGQQRRQDRLEALQTATQRFITASTSEEIAEMTVDFASRVLDQEGATVFLADETETALEPVALSDSIQRHFDPDELVVVDRETALWETYADGTVRDVRVEELDHLDPFGRLLLVPIGDVGVLSVGSRDVDRFPQEDEQFATILARTTQVALAQAEREQELRQSRASIERRNEQIEFFNGVLRHTLRNALLVIQGRADFLREHVDEPREAHLDRIVQWCDDLAELSEEIRAINDTVSATESERLDDVDLTVLVRSQASQLRREFDDLDVEVDVEDDLVVQANELADRVLRSIVRNAVHHNDTDEPRVEITSQRAADRVQLHVADNGPGMSDEMKESVFERDIASSQTARGFGLYFVSVIMNLYGGTVWFEDNDPRGTIAVLEFQQTDAPTDEAQGTSLAE